MSNRFQEAMPKAVPWRERRHTDAWAAALIARDATDAEAAAVYAAECEELRGRLQKMLELEGRAAPVVLSESEQTRIAVTLERQRCAKIANDPIYGTTGRAIAVAIERETGK